MSGSRRWVAGGDYLQLDVPAPFTTGAATLLVVCRPETVTGDDFALLSFREGLPEYGYSVGGRYTYWYTGSSDAGTSATAPLPGVWTVQAASKAAGSARPRFHRVRLDGGGPATHEDASGSADDVVPAAPLWVGNNELEDYTFPGEIAAIACWGRALSDGEIEQCVTWEAIEALRPDLACRLDGEPPFDGQLALNGTAHAEDEPPGFWDAASGGESFVRVDGAWVAAERFVRVDGAWVAANGSPVETDGSYLGFAASGPPANWRPYAPTSPFNLPVGERPQIHPQSEAIMRTILDYVDSNGGRVPGNVVTEQEPVRDYGHPIYYARPDDPVVTVSAGSYAVSGHRIRVPDGARPAGGDDGHIGIVQPDGWIYEAWQATSADGVLSASIAARSRYDGPGIVTKAMQQDDRTIGGLTASYFGLHAGIIRGPELLAERIEHALFVSVVVGAVDTSFGFGTVPPGYNGAGGAGSSVYPAYKGDAIDTEDPTRVWPPMGARFWLEMTEEEIDATTAPGWEKAIAKAMAKYGGYFGDTGGPGFGLQFESYEMYRSLGRENPFRLVAERYGLSYNETFGYTFVFGQTASPIPWAERLRVIVPPEVVA